MNEQNKNLKSVIEFVKKQKQKIAAGFVAIAIVGAISACSMMSTGNNQSLQMQPAPTNPEHIIIKGEQYSTDLTSLNLNSRDLQNEDIIPLSFMTNLKRLVLENNQISDLAPLSELTELKYLYLGGNQISDLTPLSSLANLNELYLMNNQINDIMSLSALTNLATMNLWSNQISDWSPVEHVQNVWGRPPTKSVADGDSLVWVLPPTIEYEAIFYRHDHGDSGFYVRVEMEGGGTRLIDTKTGKTKGWEFSAPFFIPYHYRFFSHPKMEEYYKPTDYSDDHVTFDEVIRASQGKVIAIWKFTNQNITDAELESLKHSFEPYRFESPHSFKYGKYAIFNNGEYVSDFIYDHVIGGDSIAFARQDGKYALLDMNGELLTDFLYNDVGEVAKRYAAVSLDGKWGFTDKSGNVMIDFMFDKALVIDESTAFAKYNGRYGILNVAKTAAPFMFSSPLTATPTASPVTVDGKKVVFNTYRIEGSDYFKLRDLAYFLSGTPYQFEVEWDIENNTIFLTTGEPYTIMGGEKVKKGQENKTPTPTSAKIFLDGEEKHFTAYTIEGDDYFKLRDIGDVFDFKVTKDVMRNIIWHIIEIGGERYSTASTYLNLFNKYLQKEDIVPLKYMTNLTKLNLNVNHIVDVTPLQSLTNLTELRLFGNRIRDVTPLQSLTNLIDLDLRNNPISDAQIQALRESLPNCQINY